MTDPLHLLLVEDSAMDAELIERTLHRAGIDCTTRRVDNQGDLLAALDEFRPDLVLADYHLPGFDGLRALAICRAHRPEVPFIFVTGAMGEELAVESIKQGATDYILKDRLARLPSAVQRALEERRVLGLHARTQADLRASEERYRQLFETIGSGVAIYTPDPAAHRFSIRSVNGAVERIERVTRQDVVGRDLEEVFPGVAAIGLLEVLWRVAESGVPERLPPALYRDSRVRGWRENAVYRLGTGEVVAVYDDVTERVAHETQIERLNHTLRTISACNQDLVRARCEDDLLHSVCRDLVEIGGYALVWVALPDPAAPAGLRTGIALGVPAVLADFNVWLDAPERVRASRTADAMAQGRTLTDAAPGAPLPADLAGIALPLVHDQESLGVLTVLAAAAEVFDRDEVQLLEQLAADLARGMAGVRTALERNRYLSQLGQAMRGTIAALTRAVEMRDPYTAGHQQRVAALAVAVGQAMGLPEAALEGLYLGGMIHDIGKISIPAEILTKPRRLTPIEHQLIQQHPLTGAQIVAGIDFPWPLSEMILQHHERIDGSGYPHGLCGAAMRLESKIIAVADVIEAMSSHRPYRAALGVETALAEIERGRGTLYDPEVVAACLSVVNAGGLKLLEPSSWPPLPTVEIRPG